MNKVLLYRTKLQCTQSELAEKSGLSLRTVQRIESGNIPKGHTLKALAKALDVDISELKGDIPLQKTDTLSEEMFIKYINLSALSFIIIPFGNIIFPMILIFATQETKIRKKGFKILNIQIFWTLITTTALITCIFIQKSISTKAPLILMTFLLALLVNIFIIITNAISLHRKNDLKFSLKINAL